MGTALSDTTYWLEPLVQYPIPRLKFGVKLIEPHSQGLPSDF